MSMPLPAACPDGQLHAVARGDTLFLLANRFHTTVSALRLANPQLTNPNVLVIGQKLCIPTAAPPVTPAGPPLPEPPACPEGIVHTVARGETLLAIANRHGQALSRVIAANPQLSSPDALVPGQHICIPVSAKGMPPVPPPPPACTGGTIVTLKAGETMAQLAKRFGLGLQTLIAANPQVNDPNLLAVGQRLCVPGVISPPPTPGPPPPACTGGNLYTVKAGDTLFAIASAHRVTLERVLRANPQLTDPSQLVVGQVICVPIRGEAPGTV
jgi:LysM repeat protein